MATSGDFSIGISAEEKLALPLDELIQKTKKHKLKTKTTESKVKITQKKSKNLSHKQKNVKKTVIVPIPKVARAKANAAFASAKRQTVINKRRPGLVLVAKKGKKVVPTVQLRPFKTSAARKQLKESKAAIQRGIDVSNIINHFRSHPKKFDVPKGSNLRITIKCVVYLKRSKFNRYLRLDVLMCGSLNNVKPVVGGKK